MWNTNNENAIIKSLTERLEKVEKKLNEISSVVKEPKRNSSTWMFLMPPNS